MAQISKHLAGFGAARADRLRPRLAHKAATAAVLVIAADMLFYDRALGISAALFLLLLGGAGWYANRRQFGDPAVRSATILAAAGCLALIENVSCLSAAFALAGLVSLALPHHACWHRDGARWLGVLFEFAIRGWLLPFKHARTYRIASRKRRHRLFSKRQFIAWVLPLGLTLVFIGLFADANPIIFDWLAAIGDIELPDIFEPWRMLFWLAAALACWPFVRPRMPRTGRALPAIEAQIAPAAASTIETLFSAAAILRSLVIFNGMFAVQTVLDAAYLWGGRALPDGMSYAEYAHRGAYPLVAAALLAAGFVLIAMRPGSDGARQPMVRLLVYAWVAQTIVLVGASVWRTGLYVSVYSLTYLRVAALIWMALVAVGLVWIVLRLLWNKSNAWLVKVNLLTAMGVLYIVCFVDIGGAIARFNVEHSSAAAAAGFPLDLDYLEEIGPPALPALDWYLNTAKAGLGDGSTLPQRFVIPVGNLRRRLASDLDARHGDWRGYSFRSYRLASAVAKAGPEPYDRPAPTGEWKVERP